MRIGIDCRAILNPPAGEHAGVGYYTTSLIKHLLDLDHENEYVLFFDHEAQNLGEYDHYPNVKVKRFPYYQYKKYLPFSYSQLLMSAFIAQENLDVYHPPADVIPFTYQGNSVITVHDLALFRHPEWFNMELFPVVAPHTFSRRFYSYKMLLPGALKQAKKVIAVSQHTKKDLMELFDVPDEKIQVIYNGIDYPEQHASMTPGSEREYLERKFGVGHDYVLCVATLGQRKNIEKLTESFRNLILENPELSEYNLIIAGSRGYKYGKALEAIRKANYEIEKRGIEKHNERRSGSDRRSGIDRRGLPRENDDRRKGGDRRKGIRIHYVGYISDKDKSVLMRNASCFAFPSKYEGFGIPVLEAMSMGVPVVASNTTSIPEIADEAACLMNPEDSKDMTRALKLVLTDRAYANKLRSKGFDRAKQFNWRLTAQATLDLYKEVGGV